MKRRVAVDVGYAKQRQYGRPGSRIHIVVRPKNNWVLLCKGTPGTREYKGWLDTVTCRACLAKKEENG